MKRRSRLLGVQSLEDRRLLVASLEPSTARLDVNLDGIVSALDSLQVINAVQRNESGPEFDVNLDEQVSAGWTDAMIWVFIRARHRWYQCDPRARVVVR